MQIGPGVARRRKPPRLKRSVVRKVFRDVEALAEVVADTVERLDARGLHDLAQPLEEALVKLAGRRMPDG